MTAGAGRRRVPAAEDEARLWELVETAWAPLGAEINQLRCTLAAGPPGGQRDGLSVLVDAGEGLIDSLASQCHGLTAAELTDLDRVVERKLYDIDNAQLHAVTEGSDDGFLYARGFTVAIGRGYKSATARS